MGLQSPVAPTKNADSGSSLQDLTSFPKGEEMGPRNLYLRSIQAVPILMMLKSALKNRGWIYQVQIYEFLLNRL